MKARFVPVAAGALFAAAIAGGCADPCGDLKVICDKCADPNQKTTCQGIVDTGVHATCSDGIDSFNNVCK